MMYGVYRDEDGDLCLGITDSFGYTMNPTFWSTVYEGSRLDNVVSDPEEREGTRHILPLEFFD